MDETRKIIEEFVDYNKQTKVFALVSKVDKEKSEPKPKESIAKRVQLRRTKIAEIKEEEKKINNKFFKEYSTNYQSPSDMYKTLREAEGRKNENQVCLIKKVLNRMKKPLKMCLKIKHLRLKRIKRLKILLNVVLYFNQLDQSGQGL